MYEAGWFRFCFAYVPLDVLAVATRRFAGWVEARRREEQAAASGAGRGS
jgi:hypothetical protein